LMATENRALTVLGLVMTWSVELCRLIVSFVR